MRIVAFLILLLCSSCAGAHPGGAGHPGLGSADAVAGPAGSASAQSKRLLVLGANLDIEVQSLAEIDSRARRAAEGAGGYVSDSTTGEEVYTASIRVAPDKLNQVLDELSRLGNVQSKSIQAEDVTESVEDLEARLRNLTALRDRYRLLLDRTKDVKDLLAVEQELNRVEGEIERAEGQRSGLRKRLAYSTIRFSAREATIYGPVGYVLHGAWWAISKLFIIR